MKTNIFEPIQLDQMNRVKLMNRTDRKFWFHADKLPEILHEISSDYYMLNIKGETKLQYTTSYFDTLENMMYTRHHNGKLNRYKIRRRTYVSSELSFLEIKFKNNKGRTEKKRIKADHRNPYFSITESEFIKENSPYAGGDLFHSLTNDFDRITLVNKNFKERCTIDQNLRYSYGDMVVSLEDMIIVEIKSEGKTSSPLALALRDHRIQASGFSKYCIGRNMTSNEIKQNAFKKKIRRIEKTIHINFNTNNKKLGS